MDKDKKRAREKRYRDSKKGKKYRKEYYRRNKETITATKVRSYRKTKKELMQKVIDHYGCICSICGETRPEALLIHHKEGGGAEQRKTTNGIGFLRWIISNDYPNNLAILCGTCHLILHRQQEKGE